MLDLHDREWKDFRLLDYFRHEKGNQNNMAELRPGAFPLVSARNANNGYKDFVSENEKKHSFEGFCLTINNDGDGGAGISYYQPCKMLLDSHVTALYPKASMTEEILKFFSACIPDSSHCTGSLYGNFHPSARMEQVVSNPEKGRHSGVRFRLSNVQKCRRRIFAV